MAYPYGLAPEDLYERLSPSRVNDITDGDASKIEQAAHDTAGEIELYAGKYYAVPLAPFTPGLRMVFLDLWRWRLLFNCKPEWLNNDDRESEEHAIAQGRKRLEIWLAGLASEDRATVLPGIAERTSPAPTTSGAWSTGSAQLMTRRSLLKL